jgi:hypothetical protein
MPVILVAGSRKLRGQKAYNAVYDLVETFPSDTIVVSGMADGPDIYGHHAAKVRGLYVKEYPVDQKEYLILKKRAYYVRDMIMGVYTREHKGIAHLFILRDILTPGTRIMRDFCVEYNIPITWHELDLTSQELRTPVRDWRKPPLKE